MQSFRAVGQRHQSAGLRYSATSAAVPQKQFAPRALRPSRPCSAARQSDSPKHCPQNPQPSSLQLASSRSSAVEGLNDVKVEEGGELYLAFLRQKRRLREAADGEAAGQPRM